ncbi:hypothetical protein NP233_g8468 [Leucocoprinus birnbaumii]|uniref:Protein kinase domain-containing protein n=1 Tax=Leucocoprinus birnbaumii TaxID=56174 RepID=A0AAD5VMD8_9AGAR|nr:hypothetical protein NP233_g8468 [Leucocoprinus birnbaumii]
MPWFCPSSRVRRARSTSVPHESLYLSKKFVKELSRETLQFHGTSSHSDVEIGKLKNLGLVVVKTFRPRRDSRADTNGLQHALMEWKRVASHPNIIDFEGLWVRPYRVFPSLVLRKMDLDAVQYVSANPTADKSSVVYQVGLALEFIHSQTPPVIHGSVKSSNVLMDDCGRAYLSDIGIRDAICCSGQLDSQMRWDAPERIFHDPEEPLHRCSSSDVWSFGMTALEVRSIPSIYTTIIPAQVLSSDLHLPSPLFQLSTRSVGRTRDGKARGPSETYYHP